MFLPKFRLANYASLVARESVFGDGREYLRSAQGTGT